MIRGNAKITVDGQEATLGEGDTIVIPAGSVHKMENIGTQDAEFIVIAVSKGTGGRTVIV